MGINSIHVMFMAIAAVGVFELIFAPKALPLIVQALGFIGIGIGGFILVSIAEYRENKKQAERYQ